MLSREGRSAAVHLTSGGCSVCAGGLMWQRDGALGTPPPTPSTDAGGSARLLPQQPLSLCPRCHRGAALPGKPPEGQAELSSCPQRTGLNGTPVGEVKRTGPLWAAARAPRRLRPAPRRGRLREALEALTDVLWDPLAGSAVETRSIIMFYCGF